MKKITKIDGVQNNSTVNKELRVAAYCRVSTGSDAQLESLEAQKTHYERYINSRKDWKFAGLYFDEGITGTKAEKRPELLRLIADCEARKIDFVITKSISRFSRNTTDCLALVRKLQSLSIPIFFEKENINTGSMESELFLAILSSMAEGESASISENSKWSIKRRFRNGTFKLSYTPYGYDWDGENMIINPAQAAVVKRIFADILSGKSTNAIADELNAEKIPSKKKIPTGLQALFEAFSLMKNIQVMSSFKKHTRMKTSIATQIMVKLISTWHRIIMKQLSATQTLMRQMRWYHSVPLRKVSKKVVTNTKSDMLFQER